MEVKKTTNQEKSAAPTTSSNAGATLPATLPPVKLDKWGNIRRPFPHERAAANAALGAVAKKATSKKAAARNKRETLSERAKKADACAFKKAQEIDKDVPHPARSILPPDKTCNTHPYSRTQNVRDPVFPATGLGGLRFEKWFSGDFDHKGNPRYRPT